MLLLSGFSKSLYRTSAQIERRIRFVVSALLMTFIMFIATFFFFDKAFYFIPLFLIVSYSVTYFSILQGIEEHEWLLLFLMPLLFTTAFYLFYLLFPVRWLTRLPFVFIYGFSFYAILLTSNIFNVGVEKSLQLYRAAFSVNFFYQTLVMFITSNVIFALRLNPLINGLLIFIVTFLLSLQLLWSVRPKKHIERQLVNYSLLVSFFIVQLGIVLSFVPVKLSVTALFITAAYYSLCGLLYHYLEQKLFAQTIREYIFVICFVAIITLLSLQW